MEYPAVERGELASPLDYFRSSAFLSAIHKITKKQQKNEH